MSSPLLLVTAEKVTNCEEHPSPALKNLLRRAWSKLQQDHHNLLKNGINEINIHTYTNVYIHTHVYGIDPYMHIYPTQKAL